MALIPHTFDSANHRYRVDGEFVLSTSSVIELNGLSDMGSVPYDNLRHASARGTGVHLAIFAHETGCSPIDAVEGFLATLSLQETPFGRDLLKQEIMERLGFYLAWRKEHKVKLVGKMEQSRVYRHIGTEQLIGATPDMICLIDDELFILDGKTCFKQFGEKAKQLALKWRVQLQSYKEALESEDAFLDGMRKSGKTLNRAILHLHPMAGKTGVKGEQTGYEFHRFDCDDSYLLDSCIRVATAKLANGYKLGDRT